MGEKRARKQTRRTTRRRKRELWRDAPMLIAADYTPRDDGQWDVELRPLGDDEFEPIRDVFDNPLEAVHSVMDHFERMRTKAGPAQVTHTFHGEASRWTDEELLARVSCGPGCRHAVLARRDTD